MKLAELLTLLGIPVESDATAQGRYSSTPVHLQGAALFHLTVHGTVLLRSVLGLALVQGNDDNIVTTFEDNIFVGAKAARARIAHTIDDKNATTGDVIHDVVQLV